MRNPIIDDFKNGLKQKVIAVKYNIPTLTAYDLIKRFRSGKPIEITHSGGRQRKTTPTTDRRIKHRILKDPFVTSKVLVTELSLPTDSSTVRRRLKEVVLYAFRPAKKQLLNAKHRLKR